MAKKGSKLTEKTKRQISISKKNTTPWNKGKEGLQTAWNKNLKGYMKGEKNGMYKNGLSDKNNLLKQREKAVGRVRPESCEICGAIGQIDFDHDHKTGEFRGWICRRCNLVLGMVKDNSELLIMLSQYVLQTDNSNNQDKRDEEED